MCSSADWTEETKKAQARAIAELVRDTILAEREACAKVADDYARDGRTHKEYACETADELAARIRARTV